MTESRSELAHRLRAAMEDPKTPPEEVARCVEILKTMADLAANQRHWFQRPSTLMALATTAVAVGGFILQYAASTRERDLATIELKQAQLEKDQVVQALAEAAIKQRQVLEDIDRLESERTRLTKTVEALKKTIDDAKTVTVVDKGRLETAQTSLLTAQTALQQPTTDELSLTRTIEKQSNQGQYAEVLKNFEPLKKSQLSGVGFSVYPLVAFAYDQTEDPKAALRVLVELQGRMHEDAAKGYGYLAPGRGAVASLRSSLSVLAAKCKSPAVAAEMTKIRDSIPAPASAR